MRKLHDLQFKFWICCTCKSKIFGGKQLLGTHPSNTGEICDDVNAAIVVSTKYDDLSIIHSAQAKRIVCRSNKLHSR